MWYCVVVLGCGSVLSVVVGSWWWLVLVVVGRIVVVRGVVRLVRVM